MNSKKTIKKVLIGLLVAVALLVVYSIFVSPEGTDTQSSLSSILGTSSVGQIKEEKSVLANAEILRILGNIQNISLDDDIFSNPVFYALQDNNFRITTPNNPGRPNPFLPIGFDAISQFLDTQEEDQAVSEENNFFN